MGPADIARVFDVPVELLGRPTTYENDQAVQDQTVREMTEIWEGGDMGFKKFGTGEITETEETTTAKTAAKRGEWTEDDNQALARENAQADREDD